MTQITLNQSALEKIKPFQVEDSDFVAKNGNVVLGHKTGMGKSLIALRAWSQWSGMNKVLILGGKSAASTWNKQPMEWADTQTAFNDGYSSEWANMLQSKEGIWYSTYTMFQICMKQTKKPPEFDLIIADEAHKLRNRKTLVYEQMRRVDFKRLIALSATWASRGPQDLWAIMHLIDPSRFSSYWRWVNTYCFVEESNFGKDIFGVKNKAELQKLMNGKYYRSRTWEDIGAQMDPIRREMVEVDMTKDQKKVYTDLDAEMYAEFEGAAVVTPSSLAKLTRLLQVAFMPSLLFPTIGTGGAMDYILESIEDDPHTVVYVFFTEAIPLVEAALRGKGHGNIFSLKGGMAMKAVDDQIAQWKKTKGIMICSVRFAESFRIDTCHTAYMLGFSWDPNDNIQAEGRLRAIDSTLKSPVLVKYIVIRNTVVEALRGVVNDKFRTVSQIFADYAAMHAKGRVT